MKIYLKILGAGCSKCSELEEITRQVVAENSIEAEINKTGDIVEIMGYKVLSTPALVVNEKVVVSGRVPSKPEIKALIENNS